MRDASLENVPFMFMYLGHSRVEVAGDTRHSARCCGRPLLLRCNEVDGVRSARPKGKRCRHKTICYPSKVSWKRCRQILWI